MVVKTLLVCHCDQTHPVLLVTVLLPVADLNKAIGPLAYNKMKGDRASLHMPSGAASSWAENQPGVRQAPLAAPGAVAADSSLDAGRGRQDAGAATPPAGAAPGWVRRASQGAQQEGAGTNSSVAASVSASQGGAAASPVQKPRPSTSSLGASQASLASSRPDAEPKQDQRKQHGSGGANTAAGALTAVQGTAAAAAAVSPQRPFRRTAEEVQGLVTEHRQLQCSPLRANRNKLTGVPHAEAVEPSQGLTPARVTNGNRQTSTRGPSQDDVAAQADAHKPAGAGSGRVAAALAALKDKGKPGIAPSSSSQGQSHAGARQKGDQRDQPSPNNGSSILLTGFQQQQRNSMAASHTSGKQTPSKATAQGQVSSELASQKQARTLAWLGMQ
jgi:hypothetical protein